MKRIERVGEIVGTVNSVFNQRFILILANLTNKQSYAINELIEHVERIESEIERLKAGEQE